MSKGNYKIIVSDIGGTNSRFAAFEAVCPDQLNFVRSVIFDTGNFSSFEELVSCLPQSSFKWSLTDADIIVLAVPGPVQAYHSLSMANVGWPIHIADLKAMLPERVMLFVINDFVAQAYGCLSKAIGQVKQIKNGQLNFHDTIAVIGAGTGLGYCSLRCESGNRYVGIPSEGGHALFPFVGSEEVKFQEFVMAECGLSQVRGDDILSGRGLAILHRYLTGKNLDPSEIASEFTKKTETGQWFARFYGRACRDYVLTVLALGGVFLSGGIAAKNPALFEDQAFMEEFSASQDKRYLLENVPVFLVQDDLFGLWGAATYGRLNAMISR